MKMPREIPCPFGCKTEENKPVMVKIGCVCPSCQVAVPHGSESTVTHSFIRRHAYNFMGKTEIRIYGDELRFYFG